MLEHLTLQPQLVVALPLVTTPLDASLSAFLLAQEAARHTPRTLEHYRYTIGGFIAWLKARGVSDVTAIAPYYVRTYLVALQKRGLKGTTQHARGLRAWCNWLAAEGDLEHSPMRRMPCPSWRGASRPRSGPKKCNDFWPLAAGIPPSARTTRPCCSPSWTPG